MIRTKAGIHSPVATYGAALAAVAAAIALRLVLDPLLGDRVPFITLFVAVSFAAWYGGKGPGLVALLACAIGAGVFVLDPRSSLAIDHIEHRVGLVLFVIFGLVFIYLFDSLRRAWKEAAQKSELLRTTLASIGDAVITTDSQARITNMNAVAASLTGWRVEDAMGQPLDVVFHIVNEQTRKRAANPALRALEQGTIVGFANHTILIAKDGSERSIDDSAAPIRQTSGDPAGAVLVFRDVTARRRVLVEQEQALTTLKSLVASAPMGVAILDHEMRFVHINGPLAEMNGRPAADHLGKSVAEMVPDLYPQTEPLFRKVLETNAALPDQILEGETPKAPGTKRVWRESWFPIPDASGKPSGVGVIVQEITQERLSEERLRKRNERIRLLSEAAESLLVADDPKAMLSSLFAKIGPHLGLDVCFHFLVNEASDALALAFCTGVPEDVAKTLVRLEFGQALCGTAALNHQSVVATHIQSSDDPNAQLVKSFGVRSYACNPLLAGDRLLGTLSFGSRSRDAFESDELEFLATLGQYVTFAYERVHLIGQLSEANRRKDEFLATLAHELRNPLAPVKNSLELMKRANGRADLIETARSTMERQIGQMVRLVDDLLDVSRITRDKLELKKERVELASVVHHAVEATGPHCEQAGQELIIALPPEEIYLNADPMRLAQVFGNLLNNSSKYTRRGGRIWLNAERQGSEIVVKVKDSGIGIPPEMLPRVFDLFTQGDRSLERSEGGLGIGLSLVRRLVELHGGTVTAHSDGPDRGSEFIVRLPILCETPTRHPVAGSPSEPASATQRRILVVDDNRDNADSLALLLSQGGNDIQTAHDGAEAIVKGESFRPDVILLDLGMPKMNGYEACRIIRDRPWGKEVVMVALTGWGQDEDRRKSKEAGFDSHLVKPADPGALTRLLDSLTPGGKPGALAGRRENR